MTAITQKLIDRKVLHPIKNVDGCIHFEGYMGSISYGIDSNNSDIDIYGFCIPSSEVVFPHLAGEIPGFGKQIQRFEQFQIHHLEDPSDHSKEYDINIYNIVKYFQLCMENNPNMVDSLFIPKRSITYMSEIGKMVIENRKIFLHKGAYHKFSGYAYSQLNKINTKVPKEDSKRYESYMKYGYDLKFATHLVRLLNECEQILIEGDLDLEKNREQLKSVKRGDWTKLEIEDYFKTKQSRLEKLYIDSGLQHFPDEEKIKQLLLNCLEMEYGSLDDIIIKDTTRKLDFVKRELEQILRYL